MGSSINTDRSGPNRFDRIPNELLDNMLSWLVREDKIKCRAVCVRWKQLLDMGQGREYWGWPYDQLCLFGSVDYCIESMVWMTKHLNISQREAKFCDCFAFRRLCETGQLAAAKWFVLQFAITPAEAQYPNDNAYFWAKTNGHTETAQWIIDEFDYNPHRSMSSSSCVDAVEHIWHTF
jgi:hypothetical protein